MIFSASVGAGHDGTTLELASRLRRLGFEVDCYDFMGLLPGRLGRRVVGIQSAVLRRAPWIYGALFAVGRRLPGTPPITRALLYPARRRLSRMLPADLRAVVSTHPLPSQALGPLRRSGQLAVPAVTVLTDWMIHRHWVAPGIDAHLALHPVSADQARALHARGVRVGGALVRGAFRPRPAAAKRAARAQFGLPHGRLALVVAGSWGVGDIEATVTEIANTGSAVPVVVCGRNDALRRRLAARGVRYVFGWIDDMPALMRAVDVVVENAGGLTALEAMASGLPVLTYRPIPGHGKANAATLAEAAVALWVRGEDSLGAGLIALTDGAPGRRQRSRARALFDGDAAADLAGIVTGAGPGPGCSDVGPVAGAADEVRRRRTMRTTAIAASVASGVAAVGVAIARRPIRGGRRVRRPPPKRRP